MISTHDLAGKGKFTLFTGVGGKKGWVEAAGMVKGLLGVEVVVHSIGWREDYRDVFFDLGRKRGVGERGAVLVRPDRVVAWRCDNVGGGDGWGEKLTRVMGRILGLLMGTILVRWGLVLLWIYFGLFVVQGMGTSNKLVN